MPVNSPPPVGLVYVPLATDPSNVPVKVYPLPLPLTAPVVGLYVMSANVFRSPQLGILHRRLAARGQEESEHEE